MPHKGYHQSDNHRYLLSCRAKLRGNNGWLGRHHRLDAIEKMRGSAIKRWNKDKVGWTVKPVVKQPPVAPMYRDIFMEDRFVDGEGTVWQEVGEYDLF